MDYVREIIDVNKLRGIVDIPKTMEKSKVEIILLPLKSTEHNSNIDKKIQAINELNGLIADYSTKETNDFDEIIKERNFRKKHLEL